MIMKLIKFGLHKICIFGKVEMGSGNKVGDARPFKFEVSKLLKPLQLSFIAGSEYEISASLILSVTRPQRILWSQLDRGDQFHFSDELSHAFVVCLPIEHDGSTSQRDDSRPAPYVPTSLSRNTRSATRHRSSHSIR